MKSLELRKKFFDFFVRHGHEKVVSSSLIPTEDPTLLFANAGMNQFKDVFLGNEKRSYKKAVSIQKCVRAGGKHNDLENVGFTQRHLTFFEMMGNFSFGDYFKKEAIAYAWDFLTKEVGLNPAELYVTVHHSDQESYDIWHEIMHIPKDRIFKLGESNFWQMGDVGPCGPCTEIFVDRGSKVGCGGKDCSPDCGCDRFLEVWNNVFMQFSRQADGTDILLKQTGVDTGMGLERLALVVQKKESVFETDAFESIFNKIESLTGHNYQNSSEEIRASFNVLGDHIRSSTFLISDGCAPSNDGRGYVLRKIIRRAALFAQKLTDENIFPELSLVLVDDMKSVYPELESNKERIASVLKLEIERFSDNLVRGKRILQDYMHENNSTKLITGDYSFMLYDTYGFPLEVTKLIALEAEFVVDEQGFEKSMEAQRQRSGKKMKDSSAGKIVLDESVKTEFTGYQKLHEDSEIVAILVDDVLAESVEVGATCWIAAKKSPFYVACGGQINDVGIVEFGNKHTSLLDLKKINDAIFIKIIAPEKIMIGDLVTMTVDKQIRFDTMKNHTATHLLQAALQNIFGNGVKQAGSIVTPDYLRFDFTYHKSLSQDEIKTVEELINQKIWDNISVVVDQTTYKDAIARGVTAFFGDKYNMDNVRAIIIDKFSAELCGGTHVKATGDIGMFKITEEISLAAGQRRIVAITGRKALAEFQQDFSLMKKLCLDLKTKPEKIIDSVTDLGSEVRDLQKEIKVFKSAGLKSQISSWANSVEMINNIPFLYLDLNGYSLDDFRDISLQLQKQKPGFYFLIQADGLKTIFLTTLDKSLVSRVSMQEFKTWLQENCNLSGGGNQSMVQGGGAAINGLKCLEGIKAWLAQRP
ncbi:MAG: alanine--tRNA ligase [Candidatus Dependentiae bacterium]|nr:alanine--tRNA ligase [Candidatus Dependentiae bacterium]